MSRQWREANIWPPSNLVRYFAPTDFKAKFPTTRIIVDGTECPIKQPKAPRAQQATISSYKNRNTVKILVGSTPGGLVNFVSDAYGGCEKCWYVDCNVHPCKQILYIKTFVCHYTVARFTQLNYVTALHYLSITCASTIGI
jgi:hypothetical protein